MPQAILIAVAYAGGYIGAVQAVFAVATFAISTAMANRAQKKGEAAQRAAAEQQRAAFNAGLIDRTSVIRSAIQPRNIILGRDEASGPLACWFTYGPLRNFHAFAVVLAGHECDAIETVMFNHEAVTLDGSGAVIAPAKYVRTVSTTYSERFPGGPAGQVYTLSRVPGAVVAVVSIPGFSLRFTVSGNQVTTLDDSYFYYIGGQDPTPGPWEDSVVTYTVTTYEPLFYIRKYLGQPGQSAAPELVAAAAAAGIPGAWDASRKGTSLCYLTCVMEADFNVLGQIGVPNLSGVTRGVKAYDARTGLTAWTQNPAVLARWFQVDSGYAPQTLSSEIHAGELLASANVSDEGVYFSASRYEARYTCNGQLTTAASPLDNLNHILDSMDGDAVWISGQWQIVAGYYKTPTLEIDENTLSSAGITVAPRTAKRDLFNGISGTFVNPAAGYVRMGYSMVTSTVYQAEDGGELLPADVSFELVNDPVRCQMIAWQRLTRARQPLTLQLGTTLKGYDSAPLQTVNVNLARLGYVDKVFTNLRREFENNTLLYILQETGPAVWAWNYTNASAAVDIPNTSFPDVASIPALTGITTNSGTEALQLLGDGTVISRVRLRWTAVTNTYVLQGGKIEWQHKNAIVLTDDWTALPPAPGGDVEIFTGALVDGDLMLFRGRCVTGQGREGDWCPVIAVTVFGKTEPPPDVGTFTIDGTVLRWSAVTAVDLAGYLLRFNYGNNTFWGSGTPLHAGVVTTSPYTLSNRPSGMVTLMVKAVDTTGNQSANGAVIVVNLGDPLVNNVLLGFAEAPLFTGTITNGSVVGGVLQATANDLFYGDDRQPFYGPDGDPFYALSTYLPMVYEWSVSATEAGTLLLQFAVAASDFGIEYRRDSQAAFYGPDADLFYGPDVEPFYGVPGAYAAWPGSLDLTDAEDVGFRISTAGGPTQGQVTTATVILDVPDVVESFADLVISAAGTHLPITKNYRAIQNVSLSVQADGNGGVTARIEDKNNLLGPLITVRNAAGTQVIGLVDADIQGY